MHSPNTINLFNTDPYSALTTSVDAAIDESNTHLQMAQTRMFQLAFEVGRKMGEGIQTLRLEKLQLESENRRLENDITQLKFVHIAELNAALDCFVAKKNMIAEKVKAIVERFEFYGKKFSQHNFSSDTFLFSTLLHHISQVTDEGLRQYPEYCVDRQNNVCPQEQTAIIPASGALIPMQINSTIKALIAKPMAEYDGLASEIDPIRAANRALTDKKEMMSDFHAKYLDTINRQEIDVRLKNILKLVRSTYDRIQWETLATANIAIYDLGQYSPGGARWENRKDQDTLNKKMKKIQETVKGIISTLEAFVIPQQMGV